MIEFGTEVTNYYCKYVISNFNGYSKLNSFGFSHFCNVFENVDLTTIIAFYLVLKSLTTYIKLIMVEGI